jgi:hypothetical protein
MFMICKTKEEEVRRARPASGAEAIPSASPEMAFWGKNEGREGDRRQGRADGDPAQQPHRG